MYLITYMLYGQMDFNIWSGNYVFPEVYAIP